VADHIIMRLCNYVTMEYTDYDLYSEYQLVGSMNLRMGYRNNHILPIERMEPI
jgi:hypothetical protein